jgi:hypothetical protein
MHVKLVFAGSQADVYIDSDEPVLRINDLKRDATAGFLGINAANFSPAHFANLKVSKLADAYVLPQHFIEVEELPAGRVMSWLVSEPFDREEVLGLTLSGDEIRDAQQWTLASAEQGGILNLASVPMEITGKNTRFARLKVNSDRAESRLLKIGYSDSARVFVNGELRYAGDNTYQSRDYRYLGTIGLFDSVVLPLHAGENEILIAVTEAFGGWGVMAEFESVEGITVLNAR